jgi:hypothetical protein
VRVTWIKTSQECYRSIYREHIGMLTVHGTITRPESDFYGERHMMTEWGLRGADAPLIKHEERAGEHEFFIACVKESDE